MALTERLAGLVASPWFWVTVVAPPAWPALSVVSACEVNGNSMTMTLKMNEIRFIVSMLQSL
jgi:hypothetical protein